MPLHCSGDRQNTARRRFHFPREFLPSKGLTNAKRPPAHSFLSYVAVIGDWGRETDFEAVVTTTDPTNKGVREENATRSYE